MNDDIQHIIDQINAPFDDDPPPNNPMRNGHLIENTTRVGIVKINIVDETPPRSYHGGGPEQAELREKGK